MDEHAGPPLEGTILDGRYRVDRLVAEGGQGSVYAGEHLALGTPIAIKVLRYRPGSTLDERGDALSGFVDEARVVTRLRHDHIVRTLDQGLLPGDGAGTEVPYLVMEWCGEESLRTVLDQRRGVAMTVAEAYAIMQPIVEATAHAHTHGIAHRDLKPSNIMMLPRATGSGFMPRIIDFGIAKLFDRATSAGTGGTTTQTGASPFTAAYASPEQIAGARTGPWTDVHALGLIFVELVAGERPLGSASGASMAAIDPVRPTPRSFGIDVGPFEAVIAKAVALRPADRQRDAGELAADLRAAAAKMALSPVSTGTTVDDAPTPRNDDPDTAAPSSKTMREATSTAPAAVRSRAAWIAAALVVVASAGGIVFAMTRGRAPVSTSGTTTLSTAPSGKASVAPVPSPSVASSAQPDGKPMAKLAELTRASFEERAKAVGLELVKVDGGPSPDAWYQGDYVLDDGASGSLFWNEISEPPGYPHDYLVMPALEAIRVWTIGDRKYGLELAYAVKDNYVLSLSFPRKTTAALRAFQSLAAAFDIEIHGNSESGPDPASNAEDSRVAWRAKRLLAISDFELKFRIATTGADSMIVRQPGNWTFTLKRGVDRGRIEYFFAPTAKPETKLWEKYLLDRRARKVPFCYLHDEVAFIASEGTGDFAKHEFLSKVMEGLSGDVVCEPEEK